MSRVFADTHFFIALLSRRDSGHTQAVQAYRSGDFQEIVSTVWVLTELADGMSRIGARAVCHRFIERLRLDEGVRIVESDPNLFWRGLAFFGQREDKEWSLTDGVSFVVMGEEGIREALTGDHHFEQAGFTALLKQEIPRTAHSFPGFRYCPASIPEGVADVGPHLVIRLSTTVSRLRTARSFTQEGLAEKADVSRRYLLDSVGHGRWRGFQALNLPARSSCRVSRNSAIIWGCCAVSRSCSSSSVSTEESTERGISTVSLGMNRKYQA